jgi:aspartate carbamoyltransferase catalytic subunit
MAFRARHLLGIEHLSPLEITTVLDLAERYVDLNRRTVKQSDVLAGMTQINLFFENSTRTQSSFELAGKRLGADVMNMSVANSSVKKGETLIDTAMTLNAMHPDLLVVRHGASGAVNLLAQKVDCAVLNAGDGRHEHPTQALLDALTIRRAKGRIQRLTIAICGDIAHSRVARSNLILLGKMENRLRLIAPPTLMPSGVEDFGCELFDDMREGLKGADVVMMLRLQKERMDGGFIPSEREYYHRYGLDAEKLSHAAPDAIVMHPGPMNRGVEIDGDLADDINRKRHPGPGGNGRSRPHGLHGPSGAEPAGREGPEDRGDDGVIPRRFVGCASAHHSAGRASCAVAHPTFCPYACA